MFIAELTSYGQTVVSSQVIIDGIILLYDYIDDISSVSSISSYTQNLDEEACGNINKTIGNVRIYDASSSEYQAKTILFYIKDGNDKKIIAGYSQPTALIQKSGTPLTLFMSFDFSAFTHGFLFSSIQAGYGNASHNTDGIVHIENPDITTDDAFSVYSKLQTDALFEEAIEDATNDSHELIMGTQTDSVAAWTGVTKRSALYVGMTINYFLPYAGKANSTLNLTLADGTLSGAIPIYFRGATAVGTHFPVGSLIQLTYLENITIGSTTINAGWFAISNYVDGNTTTYLSAAQPLKAGTNGIFGRSLVMRTGADTWESIVLSYKSALAQHVLNTQSGFYTDTIFYNAGTSTITSGNSSSATMYPVYNTITYTNYFLDTVTTPFVVGKPIYFVGTIHSDGKFYFNSPVYHAQEITTSDIYVFVGLAYSSTTLFLLPYHPMFTLKNGKIVEVTTHSLAIESEIPTNVSDLNNDAGYITTETDPTVPSWAKQQNKPTYTAQEVGALPDTTQIPSNTSDLTNDSGFITSSDIPTNVSSFTNDAGYLTQHQDIKTINNNSLIGTGNVQLDLGDHNVIESISVNNTSQTITNKNVNITVPTNTNQLTNGAGFITSSDIPSNVSAFTNDAGYLTSFTETDPTVPSWAKQTNKPSYTLDEVTDGTTRKLSDYVPTTRKVNNKALSADITLNLDDVADGSSRKLSNYIPYSEILSTINGFDNRRLWQYEIHNTLWAANKRYDVTLTGFNNNNASASLFDGSFETNVVVPKEGTGIILISGRNGSKMWGGGYPYGYLEVAFYYTNIPESVTCRVYSDWEQNPGWHNVTLTNVDKNNNQALYRGANTGFYGVTQVEITINAKDSVTANVTEVAFYQTRGTLQQMAVFNKTVAQTLYHDLTGTKFIVSGGTQSQFLKADGSLDSNTYATSSQIPTKTSDLTNDSGYITSSALSGYAQTSSLKEGAYVDVDETTMTSSSDNLPTSKAVASYISSLNYATTSQIPTVNNAKLTIQRNGAQIAEFTANASSPVTANIEVPILGIKQNTTTLTPDANKIVTVTVPTTVSELSDSENYELKSNLKEGAYVDVDETTMTSSSDNLPTSKAVASYISGQGFLTQHQSLDGQVASAQYNSTDKTIEFYNASGTKLNTDIDATDFIKDGMVDTVEVTGGNLVITFNTDAGKEDIEIPITDIFNADDYYTKDDIDGFGFLTEHQSLDNCVQKVASTDNAITRFNGTGGAIQNSGVLIDDSNNLLLPLGSSATFANNAKLAIGNAWFGSNTTGGLAYGTKSGSTYTSYYTFETTAFRPVSGRDNTIDIGTSQYRWKRLYLGTAISNGTYTYSLPGATGTLALTSQIPSNVSALTNDSGYLTSSDLSEGAFVDVDETTTTSTSDNLTTGKAVASYISSLNLATQSQIPTVNNAILTIKKNNDDTGTTFTANADTDVTANLGLHAVASSGSYNDLSNKPTIPTVNNSTITIKKNTDDTGDSFTTNAASGKTINLGLHDVATSGDYDDLTNKPDINNATLTIKKNSSDTGTTFTANASQDVTANLGLHAVATSGSYNDLTNKPTIPTVNNATLTIQKNGTTVNTFTANASSPVTANITVPTTVVELSDSSDYVTQTELTEAISTPIIQAGNNISVSYSSSLIPSGYTQVEYITSTGSSYINTNIPPTDTTKVIIEAYTTSTGSFYLFGARATSSSTILFGQSGSATGAVISASVNGTSLQASTNGVAWTRSSTGQRYTIGIETNNGTFTYCVKDHTNSRYFEGTANYTLLGTQTTKIMLCAFNSSNILTGTTRIYQFEIYQNDTLAFKGIPCIRQSDGKYGLYDTVSESFFASVSSTGFSGSDRFVGTVEISAIDNKAVWGNIAGTLSNQTDLNNALGLKANSSDLATVATSGNYTDLTNKPTNVSAFTNDAGYLTSFTETDPTVPSWAKASSKPSYTLDEVTDGTTRKLSNYVPTTRTVNSKALSSNITLNLDDIADGTNRSIPTNTNQLTNGAGFITSSDLPTNHVTTDTVQTISATKTISTSSNYATDLDGTYIKVYMPTPTYTSNTGTKIYNMSINVGSDYATIENSIGRSSNGDASFLTFKVKNHTGDDYSYIDLTRNTIKYYICNSTSEQVVKFSCSSTSFVHNTDVRPYVDSTSSSTGFDLGTSNYKWKYLYISSGIKNGTYTYSLPSATGTLALTSQIPSVPLESISVDGTTQTITNKNVDLHIPDDIYSSDFICSMTRTNVSGSGNLTLSGISGPFPVSGSPMPAGTYIVRTRMQSTTASYSLTVTFGGSYTLTTTNGVIDDTRTITLSSASTYSASVTQVNANTFIKVSMFEPDVVVETVGAAAVTNDYNDLDNIPTIGNGTLTIQKNGSNVATFNANNVSNVTANITVPTNTNQLTNGAGFITSSDLPTNHVTTDTVQTITALKTFTNGIDLGTYHTSDSQSLSTQLTVWDDTTNYQGGIEVTGNFNPATEDEYNLGSSNFPWLNVYANSFVKSGGTSAQFLKADGSVDSNTYLTSSDLPSNHVTTDTAQEITGAKTIAEDKLKIGNTSTNEDIDDYVFKRGQEFIVGTQTSSTSLWKGRTVQPALYEGMCVNYFVPVASTSTTASLELTFPDNTTSGAIPVIRNAGGTVTSSHVGVGAVVQLTLLLNRTIGSTSYEKVWKMNEWYDSNTNTIGYQIRTNNTIMPVSSASGRYRLLFTSADGTKYVPANASTSTSATATKTVTQTPIDPFGRIAYYSSTTVLSENGTPGTSTLYDQYNLTIGYSFTPITLTANTPVYIKCAPQANGSAIINSTSPMVQSLPSTNDGNIYIFLGIATSATAIEMFEKHPIYYHDGTGIRIWIGSVIPTNTNQLTNGAGFITSSDLPTNHVTTDTTQTISGNKTFTGTLTGTLTGNADSASKLKLLGNNTDESYPVVFAESVNTSTVTAVSKSLYTDGVNNFSLKYNPNKNICYCDTFNGTFELPSTSSVRFFSNATNFYTKITQGQGSTQSEISISGYDSNNTRQSTLSIANNSISNGTSTVLPSLGSWSLGSSTYKWENVYANFYNGFPIIPFGTATAPSSGSSTWTVTVSPAPVSLTTGMVIAVRFNSINTVSNPQLNVNSLGAKNICKSSSYAGTTAATSWQSNTTVLLRYSGSVWHILNFNQYAETTTNTTYTTIAQSLAPSSNSAAYLSTSATVQQVNAQANIIPSSDNTYDLGSTSYKWQNLYITGGNSSHYIAIDNTGGEPTIRTETSNYGYLGTSSYRWYRGYINSLYLKYDINIYLIRINAQSTNSSYYQVINRGEDLSVSGTSYYTVNSVKILRMYNSGSNICGVDPTSGFKDTTSQTTPSNLTGTIRLLTQVYISSTSAANYIALAIIS